MRVNMNSLFKYYLFPLIIVLLTSIVLISIVGWGQGIVPSLVGLTVWLFSSLIHFIGDKQGINEEIQKLSTPAKRMIIVLMVAGLIATILLIIMLSIR